MFRPVDVDRRRVRDATGKTWSVDITVPSLMLAVEYDGSWWHAGKEDADLRKTTALTDAGWTVLRVRERPLPGLPGVWSVTSTPTRCHQTASTVLRELAAAGYLNDAATEQYATNGGGLLRADQARALIEARARAKHERRERNAA